MRDGLTCRGRRGGLLIAVAMALLLVRLQGSAQAQGAGSRAVGEDKRIVYDFTRGVDPSLYLIIRGEDSDSLSLCASSADARRDVKDRAYSDAFSKIDAMGRTYRRARPHYMESFHQLTDKNDETILNEDIRFLRAAEIYDYKRNQYRYVIDLGISRLPHLVPEIEQELLRFLRGLDVRPKDGEIVFDLNDIVGRLERNDRFTAELRRLLKDEGFRSSMRYKDDDTQDFVIGVSGEDVKIQGYDPGQYSVNSLIGSIIERSVAAKVDELLDQGYQKVTVICEGATDALPIRSRIEYIGDGRAGKIGQRLRPGSQDGAPLKSRGIWNNHDLSFARGYEGIRALAQILRPRLGSGRIEYFYTGKGVVAAAGGSQPESRRITFRLIFSPTPRYEKHEP